MAASLTSWLIMAQDERFAAAVPAAPVSNHVTDHLLGIIFPQFVSLFPLPPIVTDNPTGECTPGAQAVSIVQAHAAKSTRTLNILWRPTACTPLSRKPRRNPQLRAVVKRQC